jgi:hypothetical protein
MKLRLVNTDINDLQEHTLTDWSHKRIGDEDANHIYNELIDNVLVDRLMAEQELCSIITEQLFRDEVWGESFIRDHPDADIQKVTHLARELISTFTKTT